MTPSISPSSLSNFDWNISPEAQHDFAWAQVSAKPCVVKLLDNPGRLFIYVITITGCYLIMLEFWYLNNFKLACGGVNNSHSGETNILPDDSSAWILMSY